MAEYKNQHFVPQHYLRRFCHLGTKQLISVIIISNNFFVPKASIRGQCARAYFYGRDGRVEALLTNLEGNVETLFRDVVETNSVPIHRKMDLLTCMASMYARTERRIREMAQGPEAVQTEVFKRMYSAGVFPPPPKGLNIDSVRSVMNNASSWALHYTLVNAPLMSDLSLKVLIAPPNATFVTSDNPAVMINQMFYDRGVLGAVGLANRGLQVFLPISPSHCLVAYDPDCYRIGKGRRQAESVTISSHSDVDLINALQIINADENLYFNNPVHFHYVSSLFSRFEHLREKSKATLHQIPVPKSDGGEGLYTIFSSPGAALPGQWSFCQKTREIPLSDFGPRDPQHCAIIRQWQKETKRSWIHFSDWANQKVALLSKQSSFQNNADFWNGDSTNKPV